MNAKLIMTVEEMQDRKKWEQLRNLGIGGSDAAVIAGLNRWKSPFQLWLEKTGQAEPEDLSDNEYVYWGTVLEQAVADRFCELTGKKVRRQGMVQSTSDEWLLANVDRMVVGENAGLECKTANGFSAKQWDGDAVPDSYYLQCQHYMMVTGCDIWYIAVLIGGNHFVYKEIPRNEEDIAALYATEKAFWEKNVKGGEMPDVDGSDSCTAALRERFPGGDMEAITLPEAAAGIVTRLDELKETEKNVKEGIKKAQNELCEMLGNCEIGYIGERKITWKMQAGRTTVDSKKLKAELPDIYEKYSKKGNPIRVFKI
nr:YqaJ viral recombinase family protein [Prevotella denticola]